MDVATFVQIFMKNLDEHNASMIAKLEEKLEEKSEQYSAQLEKFDQRMTAWIDSLHKDTKVVCDELKIANNDWRKTNVIRMYSPHVYHSRCGMARQFRKVRDWQGGQ